MSSEELITLEGIDESPKGSSPISTNPDSSDKESIELLLNGTLDNNTFVEILKTITLFILK